MMKPSLALALTTALAATCWPAHALNNGIPKNTQLTHPVTGAPLDAWKLIGTYGASATQIHANWALVTNHAHPAIGQAFSNNALGGVATFQSCTLVPYRYVQSEVSDTVLCRLSNNTIPVQSQYPVLAASPVLTTEKAVVEEQGAKYGWLMTRGHAGADQLALVDFLGIPPHNAATETATIPIGVSGDSGSGIYWVHPTQSQVALLGVLHLGGAIGLHKVNLFTDQIVGWIRDTIVAAGDTPPTILTASQFFNGPTGVSAPTLDRPITIRSVNNSRSNFTFSWLTPAAPSGSTVTSYQVTLGRPNVLEQQLSVSSGTGNRTTLNGITSGVHTVCVRPQNATGYAFVGHLDNDTLGSATYKKVNCRTFDTTEAATQLVSTPTSSVRTLSNTLRRVTLSWTAPSPAPDSYLLRYSIKYTNSITRTNTIESASTTTHVDVSTGATLCASVQSMNSIGITSASSPQHCLSVN